MEEFEQELRQALERRPAPVSLKGRIMARRGTRKPRGHRVMWQRLAAALALAAVLGGAAEWEGHVREERRRGEAARQQVLTALRITGHALDQMNKQLAAHGRGQE
jgi:hypothetical protein